MGFTTTFTDKKKTSYNNWVYIQYSCIFFGGGGWGVTKNNRQKKKKKVGK